MEKLFKLAAITENGYRMLEKTGEELIEEASFENYELFLLGGQLPNMPMLGRHAGQYYYHVGMQRTGQDAFDIRNQFKKVDVKVPNDISGIMSFFENTLRRWISQYGKLMVASLNEKKQDKYLSIIKHLNFKMEQDNIGGHAVLFIS